MNQSIDLQSDVYLMNRKKRFLFLLSILLAQVVYFPINRLVQGGVVIKFAFDDKIPLWPIWAIPYLLSLVWWTGSFVWAFLKMNSVLYKRLIIAMLIVLISSYIVYILYPTYIIRPEIEGTGWQFDLMRFIYGNDRVYNALPSGHTYTTVIIMLFWWKWIPKKRWLWIGATIVVLLSTLFTRQHYMPDLLGGIGFAYIGYWLSNKLVKR